MTDEKVSPTDLVISVTKKGDDWYEQNEDEALAAKDSSVLSKMIDIIAAAQNDYFIMERGANRKQNFESYKRQYMSSVGVETPTTLAVFNKAFQMGLIKLEEVTWG